MRWSGRRDPGTRPPNDRFSATLPKHCVPGKVGEHFAKDRCIIFCTILTYSSVHVLHALEMVDTLGFNCGGHPMDQTDARNHHTETCLLRLINIIMGCVYYEQLIGESRTNPGRGEIDQRKTGQDSQLWIDVLKSFKDDTFNVGLNIRAGDPRFQDNLLNTSCASHCPPNSMDSD
jgi:hypothetical protein